jgi:uncharacterized membrane protein
MFANLQKRIDAIDIVRGIVMIIMALDHTRELIHIDFPKNDPLDYNTTTPILFFTRWITHLCAPVFVFLSGVSAYLSILKQNNLAKSRSFLIKRGLWLIFLELTLICFGIFNDIHFNTFLFQVIGAIGFGFVILGLLLSLNAKTIAGIGIAIIALHNLLDFAPDSIRTMARITVLPGAIPLGGSRILIIGYPPVPWLGLMLTGFGCGILFLKERSVRKKIFIQIGCFALVIFALLRLSNIYGNPTPWETKQNTVFTILSFFDLSKYPPSLLFDLLFIGMMFLLLTLFDKEKTSRVDNFLKVYGSVPLFYYIIHWFVIHTIKYVILYTQGYTYKDLAFGFDLGRARGENGLPLWGVYIIWLIVVMIMYPLCKKYSDYKVRNKQNAWLKYL